MKCLWISGFAVPSSYIESIARQWRPNDSHQILHPHHTLVDEFNAVKNGIDIIIGYSLGAHLLLCGGDSLLPSSECSVWLLAPFIDFRKEANLGGRVSLAEMRLLKTKLQKHVPSALAGFYERAGLPIDVQDTQYDKEQLLYGLQRLLEGPQRQAKIPKNATLLLGKADTLLCADEGKKHLPELQILPHATHELSTLLLA